MRRWAKGRVSPNLPLPSKYQTAMSASKLASCTPDPHFYQRTHIPGDLHKSKGNPILPLQSGDGLLLWVVVRNDKYGDLITAPTFSPFVSLRSSWVFPEQLVTPKEAAACWRTKAGTGSSFMPSPSGLTHTFRRCIGMEETQQRVLALQQSPAGNIVLKDTLSVVAFRAAFRMLKIMLAAGLAINQPAPRLGKREDVLLLHLSLSAASSAFWPERALKFLSSFQEALSEFQVLQHNPTLTSNELQATTISLSCAFSSPRQFKTHPRASLITEPLQIHCRC